MNQADTVRKLEKRSAVQHRCAVRDVSTWPPGRVEGAASRRGLPVRPDITRGGGPGLDVAVVEGALTEMWARWDRVLGELGGAIPAGQLQALLVIDGSGALLVPGLARQLGISVRAATRLCDHLAAAGLVTWERAGDSDRKLAIAVAGAGQRLVGWVRQQRRSDLTRTLEAMSAEGRQALIRGLKELAVELR